MTSEGYMYTDSQKEYIYLEMLKPIKLKISQIMLYDTEAAMRFLQAYNEIISQKEGSKINILKQISELEFDINTYESSIGKQKKSEAQIQTVLYDINDLNARQHQLTREEFINQFSQLRKKYNQLNKSDIKNIDVVDDKLYELQIMLICRCNKESEGPIIGGIILPDDKEGLNIAINRRINEWIQSEDIRLKNRAQKIINIMMTNSNALYSSELWELLDEMQQISHNEDKQAVYDSKGAQKSTDLAVVPNKDKKSFKDRVAEFFGKKGKTPEKVSDLKKIDVDYLAQNIPLKLLEQFEMDRLKQGGKDTEKIFMPDPKTLIYRFASKCDWTNKKGKYTYLDNKNINKKMVFESDRLFEYMTIISAGQCTRKYIDETNRWIKGDNWAAYTVVDIINYAKFIDDVFDTNWQNRLLQEIEASFFEKANNSVDLGQKNGKLKTLNALSKSLGNIIYNYRVAGKEFLLSDGAAREKFYRENSFRSDIKITPTKDDVLTNHHQNEEEKGSDERE